MTLSKAKPRFSRPPPGSIRQAGASLVEFAIIAPAFLLLMIGVIELSMAYFANLTMQHAVREGARYAVTGNKDLDPASSNQQRYQAVIQKMKASSMGIYDKVNPIITVNGTSGTSAGMFGNSGDIVVISVECNWKFATPLMAAFFKDGKSRFVVAATMRNESFGGL
ncbi:MULTISPECIES: TadE family protein [unclassified Janthinobacterium]|uniref:TadE family protein n=1 Tax=unclassified Janthinobacterium TaxID=2610881 RepID=UPI00258900F1|nr:MULTISPECIES: TadE/TadG family type IV pilus assembly protein [unclassified Janthinobacterium]MCX7294193.1 pilus assembly protein [Janthinobacterium sp.]MED5597070.1 TadE/TadG family type IV pilus assembly protein [Janthinobacterium sp. P210006]